MARPCGRIRPYVEQFEHLAIDALVELEVERPECYDAALLGALLERKDALPKRMKFGITRPRHH